VVTANELNGAADLALVVIDGCRRWRRALKSFGGVAEIVPGP